MAGILGSLLAGFDPDRPLADAHTLSAGWYTAPEVFVAERATVFGNSWQFVGRTDQLREPGRFLTADIAGEPVLVVRGTDGVLRGFFNVCRHRAAPLLTDATGCVGKLRCRYHGWTYDLEGKLRGTPEFDGVNGFCKEDNGLAPVAVAEWGPFVWVHLGADPEPVADFLAPFPTWAGERAAFAGLTWAARQTYVVNCNWKVYVDNYLDGGYHVNTVHPDLAGVLEYSGYRTDVFAKTSLQSSPLKPADGTAGKTRTGDLAAYWWAYPNFMANLYSGVMDTNLVLPIGVDRCKVVFDFYFAEGTDPAFVAESTAVADRVQAEDAEICEQVQQGLGSRAFDTGRFSAKREAGELHFHRLVWQAVRAGAGRSV